MSDDLDRLEAELEDAISLLRDRLAWDEIPKWEIVAIGVKALLAIAHSTRDHPPQIDPAPGAGDE